MKVEMKRMKMKTWRNKRLIVTACHDLLWCSVHMYNNVPQSPSATSVSLYNAI